MASPRALRKLAFQALFQLDARGGADEDAVRQAMDDVEKFKPAERDRAFDLALQAYNARDKADREFAVLAPQWPAHRQPAADRAALRLGYFELTTGRVPPKVAVSEAVELARTFGGERSPSFVNGLLDRVLKRLERESATQPSGTGEKAAGASASEGDA